MPSSPIPYKLRATLWRYQGEAAWYFLSLDPATSDRIYEPRPHKPGFGSVKVQVTIGATTWSTSVFPSKEGYYVLPVKAAVRKAEKLDDGDSVDFVLTVLD